MRGGSRRAWADGVADCVVEIHTPPEVSGPLSGKVAVVPVNRNAADHSSAGSAPAERGGWPYDQVIFVDRFKKNKYFSLPVLVTHLRDVTVSAIETEPKGANCTIA